MGAEIHNNAEQDFELMQSLYQRLRYSDPTQIAAVAQQILFEPHLSEYEIPQTIQEVTSFLAPDTDNTHIDRFAGLLKGLTGSSAFNLRAEVFPQPKYYPVTGNEGNQALAKILNSLAEASPPNDGLIRTDNLIQLPEDPRTIRDNKRNAEKAAELATQKSNLLTLFHRECLDALLSPQYGMMNDRTISSLNWFEQNIHGGQQLRDNMAAVVGDLADIGGMVREGSSFEGALNVFDRIDHRSQARSAEHTDLAL